MIQTKREELINKLICDQLMMISEYIWINYNLLCHVVLHTNGQQISTVLTFD